tara:strand:+ start:526 stop:810 length:285 start_codon:yes stop_codon:yes gene_type:complete
MLKNEVSINKETTTICELSLRINDISFTGKNPPEEIRLKAKFKESKDLIEKIFNIMKIESVKNEYKRKIFIACFNISELLKEMKFVNVFLKLSS